MTGMFAVTLPTYGGPEMLTWAEVPDPELAPGEVLIDVVAAGVNRADILQRQGHYDPPPGTSAYPGMECSGRIAAVGEDVTAWNIGDEVCALLTGGGYAQRVAVPAGQLLPVPRGIDLVDAASFPEAACTVWSNLMRVAHMSHWHTLLVHGGGSGIGTFAIQYASALGVRVLTTARTAKHDVLKALGADVTIDYTEQDFVAETLAATSNRGVDVILDIQGAAYLNRNIQALADGGCLVIIGLQGGRTGEIDLGAMMTKRATVAATTLRSRSAADKASIVSGVRAEVWPLIEAHKIVPVIDRTVPMSEAAAAHETMQGSDHIGKILLLTEAAPVPATEPAATEPAAAESEAAATETVDSEAVRPAVEDTDEPEAEDVAATPVDGEARDGRDAGAGLDPDAELETAATAGPTIDDPVPVEDAAVDNAPVDDAVPVEDATADDAVPVEDAAVEDAIPIDDAAAAEPGPQTDLEETPQREPITDPSPDNESWPTYESTTAPGLAAPMAHPTDWASTPAAGMPITPAPAETEPTSSPPAPRSDNESETFPTRKSTSGSTGQ
jgi:putative PIG3 family NAD(P)H quinone oxidoreductase